MVESAEVGLDTLELFGEVGGFVLLESPRPWLDILPAGSLDVEAGGVLNTMSEDEEVDIDVKLAFLDRWS